MLDQKKKKNTTDDVEVVNKIAYLNLTSENMHNYQVMEYACDSTITRVTSFSLASSITCGIQLWKKHSGFVFLFRSRFGRSGGNIQISGSRRRCHMPCRCT